MLNFSSKIMLGVLINVRSRP